jgi:hypothetical protein
VVMTGIPKLVVQQRPKTHTSFVAPVRSSVVLTSLLLNGRDSHLVVG